ncbi:hypothetical protein EON65_35320 [archaeon]|nr:MAG: hypothetical protein EON65_35320 [archaeon]
MILHSTRCLPMLQTRLLLPNLVRSRGRTSEDGHRRCGARGVRGQRAAGAACMLKRREIKILAWPDAGNTNLLSAAAP